MRELIERNFPFCKRLRSLAVTEQPAAVFAAVIPDISRGSAGRRNSGNRAQIMGVRRCNGAGIATDIAHGIFCVIIKMHGRIELLSAVIFTHVPMAALIAAPFGCGGMRGTDDRGVVVDLIHAACVTENLSAAGAAPVFGVSLGVRAAVGGSGRVMHQAVHMGKLGDRPGVRMGGIPTAGPRFFTVRLLGCGYGYDPAAPVVARRGDGLRCPAELAAARRAVHDLVIAASLRAVGVDLVLDDRCAVSVTQRVSRFKGIRSLCTADTGLIVDCSGCAGRVGFQIFGVCGLLIIVVFTGVLSARADGALVPMARGI